MTRPYISLLPSLVGANIAPANPVTGLTDDQQAMIDGLSSRLSYQQMYIRTRYLYYDGEQATSNLGISVPAILAGVKQVVDWPRIVVDRLVERASTIDGFRLSGMTEVDAELGQHWAANDLDSEFPLVQQDSLVGGRGYIIGGSPDSPGESPLVTVESPLNLAMLWDTRLRRASAAYQAYESEGEYKAALYLPDVTIHMKRDENTPWVVTDKDEHGFGEVPVVRFSNRTRSSDREGRSQITAAVMNTTDAVCRTLLGMEIAREVYSIPHLWILGAKESAFVGADGSKRAGMDMAMTKVIALERDEQGQLPSIGQLAAFDPSVFTKIINEHAQLMSSYTGFPPAYFGQTNTANPASADAIRVGLDGVDRGGIRVQQQSTAPLRKVGQLMWRFANPGKTMPEEMRNLSVDWVDARTPTPASTTDAITKQAAAGSIPPTSDVTLMKLGYTPLERARLAQDRALDLAAQLETELSASFASRQARAGRAIAHDLEGAEATAGAPLNLPELVPPKTGPNAPVPPAKP